MHKMQNVRNKKSLMIFFFILIIIFLNVSINTKSIEADSNTSNASTAYPRPPPQPLSVATTPDDTQPEPQPSITIILRNRYTSGAPPFMPFGGFDDEPVHPIFDEPDVKSAVETCSSCHDNGAVDPGTSWQPVCMSAAARTRLQDGPVLQAAWITAVSMDWQHRSPDDVAAADALARGLLSDERVVVTDAVAAFYAGMMSLVGPPDADVVDRLRERGSWTNLEDALLDLFTAQGAAIDGDDALAARLVDRATSSMARASPPTKATRDRHFYATAMLTDMELYLDDAIGRWPSSAEARDQACLRRCIPSSEGSSAWRSTWQRRDAQWRMESGSAPPGTAACLSRCIVDDVDRVDLWFQTAVMVWDDASLTTSVEEAAAPPPRGDGQR